MSLIYVYPPVLIPVPFSVYYQVNEAVGRVERVYATIDCDHRQQEADLSTRLLAADNEGAQLREALVEQTSQAGKAREEALMSQVGD